MTGPRTTYPLMERVSTAIILAFVSGCINAWTLMNAGLFGTIQSGNTLTAILALVIGDPRHSLYAFMSMIAFYFGAMLGGVFITVFLRRKKVYAPAILACEAFLIFFGAILWLTEVIPTTVLAAHYACMIFSFAAGMQGTAFHKEEGMLYGNVAITAVYQGLANFFGQALIASTPSGRKYDFDWFARFGGVILGFAGGAGLIGGLSRLMGWTETNLEPNPITSTGWLIFIPGMCVTILAVLSLLEAKRGANPDPAPGSGTIY